MAPMEGQDEIAHEDLVELTNVPMSQLQPLGATPWVAVENHASDQRRSSPVNRRRVTPRLMSAGTRMSLGRLVGVDGSIELSRETSIIGSDSIGIGAGSERDHEDDASLQTVEVFR